MNMTTQTASSNHFLTKIAEWLTQLGLHYEYDETGMSLCTGISTPNSLCPVIITTVADYWLCLSTWGLSQQPLLDDAALVKFYKELLKENNYTKLGKFYLNEDNHLEFAIDLRIEDLNENLLAETMDLIAFVIHERLPNIAGPYVKYLFPG